MSEGDVILPSFWYQSVSPRPSLLRCVRWGEAAEELWGALTVPCDITIMQLVPDGTAEGARVLRPRACPRGRWAVPGQCPASQDRCLSSSRAAVPWGAHPWLWPYPSSSLSSVGRNLYCCWRIWASFFLASSSSRSFFSISSWAAMI